MFLLKTLPRVENSPWNPQYKKQLVVLKQFEFRNCAMILVLDFLAFSARQDSDAYLSTHY